MVVIRVAKSETIQAPANLPRKSDVCLSSQVFFPFNHPQKSALKTGRDAHVLLRFKRGYKLNMAWCTKNKVGRYRPKRACALPRAITCNSVAQELSPGVTLHMMALFDLLLRRRQMLPYQIFIHCWQELP